MVKRRASEVEGAGAHLCVAYDEAGVWYVEYTLLVSYIIEPVRTLKRRVEFQEPHNAFLSAQLKM